MKLRTAQNPVSVPGDIWLLQGRAIRVVDEASLTTDAGALLPAWADTAIRSWQTMTGFPAILASTQQEFNQVDIQRRSEQPADPDIRPVLRTWHKPGTQPRNRKRRA